MAEQHNLSNDSTLSYLFDKKSDAVNAKLDAVNARIDDLQIQSGSNYCKLPDGTLIQWGIHEVTSGSTGAYGVIYILSAAIPLPTPFVDNRFSITGSAKYGTGAELAIGHIPDNSKTTAYVRLWDVVSRTASSSNKWVVRWMAVGRWK